MSKTGKKLGRNPLARPASTGHENTPGMQALGVRSPDLQGRAASSGSSSLDKIKEMRIEVDWRELYSTTVGKKLRKLSKFIQSL